MPLTTTGEREPYRPDIDGLRAVAVVAVILFHAFPGYLPGGFAGVDVFFVISGYLISTIVIRDRRRGAFSFVAFYQRRIARLFPALLVVLIACGAFGWFALLADEYRQLGAHIAGAAGFASNFVLLNETGYFDNRGDTKPLLHLWSLGIEEQFYVIWPPLLAAVALRWRRTWPLIAALGLASLAGYLIWVDRNPLLAFYLPFTRFWELMLGGALAVAAARAPVLSRRVHLDAIGGIGAVLLFAAFFATGERSQPWAGPVLATLGACAVIAAGGGRLNRAWLSNRPAVAIGLISYPLYLWHWPLLSFARIIESHKPSIAARLAAVLLSFALAWLTFILVEMPVRRRRHQLAVTLGLSIALLSTGAAGALTYVRGGWPSRAAVQDHSWNPVVAEQFAGSNWQYSTNPICLERNPFGDARNYPWWFCVQSHDRNPTLMVLGTSYANQVYPGLASHPALSRHTILSIGTCHPVAPEPGADEDDPCAGPQQAFVDRLIANNPGLEYIILDGLRPDPDAGYIAALSSRVTGFERSGAQVIVFEPHLKADFDIRACYSRPFRHATRRCESDASRREEMRAAFAPLAGSLAAAHPKVLFFDPNGLFCDDQRCRFVADGRPLYRDEYHHLSEYGSGLLAENFVDWARRHAPGLVNDAATSGR